MGNVFYRFIIPDDDTMVLEWLASQKKRSESLRILIKEDILRHDGECLDSTSRMFMDDTLKKRVRNKLTYTSEDFIDDSDNPDEEKKTATSGKKKSRTSPGTKQKSKQAEQEIIEPFNGSYEQNIDNDSQADKTTEENVSRLLSGAKPKKASGKPPSAKDLGLLDED